VMKSKASHSAFSIIRVIVAKDLKEYSRDKFWMIITLLVLIAFAAVYWLMPSTVDETIVMGVHQRNMDKLIAQLEEESVAEEGLMVVEFTTAAKLASAVEGKTKATGPDGKKVTVPIGVDFGSDFAADVAAGRTANVDIYVSPEASVEVRGAISAYVRELAYSLAGDESPVTMPSQSEIILGTDRAGAQVPMRERMRPVIVFMVLLTESLALSSLVATEIHTRTAAALSVTPATTSEIVAAKTTTGTILALGQAVILLLITRTFTGGNWLMLLTAALLGAVLATGIGVVSGSAGRDFIGTLFIGMVFLVPMMVPAFAVLFPGAPSAWIKVIPSYGVIQAIVGVTNYGEGWADILPYLGMAAAWSLVFCAVGVFTLGRRVKSL
jgi:ABC-2 type transport system permease protein